MGKTNVPPMLADWQANNAHFGRTNNLWDLTRTPGGSTGGGAAALAAGLTPLEVGSDIGGSIRVPAAFCGLYGHRPSETALPRSGQGPFRPVPNPPTLMGVQEPLARSADDLELALDGLAGPEGGEEMAWRLQIPEARHARLADYRVAVLPPVAWVEVDTGILAAQDKLVRGLERAGLQVRVTQPEGFGDLIKGPARGQARQRLDGVDQVRLATSVRPKKYGQLWQCYLYIKKGFKALNSQTLSHCLPSLYVLSLSV